MCHFSDCGTNWTAGGLCQWNGGLPWARKFCTHCWLHSDECCIFPLTCYLHYHSGAAQRNRQVSFYLAHWINIEKRSYSLLIPQGEIQLQTFIITNTWRFWIHMHALRERWQSASWMPQAGALSTWGCTLAVLWRCHLHTFPNLLCNQGLNGEPFASCRSPLQTEPPTPVYFQINNSSTTQILFFIYVKSTFSLFNADRTPFSQNCILLIWLVQRGKRKPKQRGIV